MSLSIVDRDTGIFTAGAGRMLLVWPLISYAASGPAESHRSPSACVCKRRVTIPFGEIVAICRPINPAPSSTHTIPSLSSLVLRSLRRSQAHTVDGPCAIGPAAVPRKGSPRQLSGLPNRGLCRMAVSPACHATWHFAGVAR